MRYICNIVLDGLFRFFEINQMSYHKLKILNFLVLRSICIKIAGFKGNDRYEDSTYH